MIKYFRVTKMSYNLNNLDTHSFETMVQSLCYKILGHGVQIYGNGPDGQREATFTGKANFPSEIDRWEGYFVVQAKFKNEAGKEDDWTWLQKNFKSEMQGFAKKKKEGKQIPDNYLFFTNVILTPKEKTGIKDKTDNLVEGYKDLIPHIAVLGRDEICVYLNNNRDVATAYSSYILSDDVLAEIYRDFEKKKLAKIEAMHRYIAACFQSDLCSRMEQAGKVTEEKISIDKIYIDLKCAYKGGEDKVSFISNALRQGDKCWRAVPDYLNEGSVNDGALRERSEKRDVYSTNKFVLKGSAGQGKSTVCQFLAQIYRVNFIKDYTKLSTETVEKFLAQLESDKIPVPKCRRIPIRIELRIYSQWIIEQQKTNGNTDLITFITRDVAKKSSSEFDNDTFRDFLKDYSFVFCFDGLDEVSENSNRKEVLSEIEKFMSLELLQCNTDSMFVATTRPEGYVGEFSSNGFTHLNLLDMDKQDCLNYIGRLLNVMEGNADESERAYAILKEAVDSEQISFMMKTPLQATIMVILVRSGGEPPRDKYSLFKSYFDIIIKREKQKGVGKTLKENQQLIENTYYLFGFKLQMRSYTSDISDALMSAADFKKLIADQMEADGFGSGSENFEKTLADVYATIVFRINFASEIQNEKIGFAIRSMQEFLAAEYISTKVSDPELKPILLNIAQSAYWKNTFLFLLQSIGASRQYYLDMVIDTVLSELNGNGLPQGETNQLSEVYWGSQVAFDILINNIFKNKPKYENKLCKYVKDFCKLQPDDRYFAVSNMSDNVKTQLCGIILNMSAEEITNGAYALAAILCLEKQYAEKLEEFIKAHPIEVLEKFYSYYGTYEDCTFPYAIDYALTNGYELRANVYDLACLCARLSYVNEFAKKHLFKLVLKKMLRLFGSEFNKNYNDIFVNSFGCDFNTFRRTFAPSTIREVNFDNILHVRYERYNITPQLSKLIDVVSSFGFNGTAAAIKAVFSSEVNDYINLCNALISDREEIEYFDFTKLFRKNSVCTYIYENIDTLGAEAITAILNNDFEQKWKTVQPVKTKEEFFKQLSEELPVFTINLSVDKSLYGQVYVPFTQYYSKNDLINNGRLARFGAFVFWVMADNDIDDSVTCNKVFYDVADYALKFNLGSFTLMELVKYAIFHKLQDTYEKFENVKFVYSKTVITSRHIRHRNVSRPIQVLHEWVRFIEISKNLSAFKYFLNSLKPIDYDIFKTLEWCRLKQVNEDWAEILYALSCDFDTEAVIAHLKSDELYDFTTGILRMLKFNRNAALNEKLLPLYRHMLSHYKQIKNYGKAGICERGIEEIIKTSYKELGI